MILAIGMLVDFLERADCLFICNTPISMRKSFEGISNVIEEKFPRELLTGSFFIFLNRQRDHMNLLEFDSLLC